MTGEDPELIDPRPVAPEDLEDIALGDDYAQTPAFVAMVIDAADRGDTDRLRELLYALRAEDVAEDGPGRPLGRSFRIKLWPTVVVLKDGQEVARVVRPVSSDEVRVALAQAGAA